MALAITLFIALIYWPVSRASFVWDDILDFQRTAWLRQGNGWQQFLFKGFNDWANYFRPLGVAAFTLQVRAFDVRPGPMHIVSLIMHLLNTLLVGLLALRLVMQKSQLGAGRLSLALAMSLYGLHPLLVEPVTWIGCQFDLLATLFMLLGLIVNTSIKGLVFRPASVALCFFLAACAKESAAAFPLFLLILDWFAWKPSKSMGRLDTLKAFLKQNGPVYVAVLSAGVAYLALRHHALGSLVPQLGNEPLPLFARLQEIAFLYLRYWKMFFWPMTDMGPIHPIPTNTFLALTPSLIINDVLATGLILTGIVLALRRVYVGGLILLVTAALLPVLHIIGVSFDSSLYHERYAMTALAIACAWLPSTLYDFRLPQRWTKAASLGGFAIVGIWLAMSALDIRMTVPLWSTQIKLWQWAEQIHPDAIEAQDELISAYVEDGYHAQAWQIINRIIANNVPCANCMLNAANLAIRENAPQRARLLLSRAEQDPQLHSDPNLYRYYQMTRGKMLLLQGDAPDAEEVARIAIAKDALDPQPQLLLATALVLQGKSDEGERAEQAAILLLPPEERAQSYQAFKALLASASTTRSDR
jgi:tetratricopeptide (TPR) repeat protein